MILTRQQLDAATCMKPGCDHTAHAGGGLVLKGQCHPRAGSTADYQQGILTLRCDRCQRLVAQIAVKDR